MLGSVSSTKKYKRSSSPQRHLLPSSSRDGAAAETRAVRSSWIGGQKRERERAFSPTVKERGSHSRSARKIKKRNQFRSTSLNPSASVAVAVLSASNEKRKKERALSLSLSDSNVLLRAAASRRCLCCASDQAELALARPPARSGGSFVVDLIVVLSSIVAIDAAVENAPGFGSDSLRKGKALGKDCSMSRFASLEK